MEGRKMNLDKERLNVIGIDRIKIYVDLVSINTEINADCYSLAVNEAKKYCEVYDCATDRNVKLSGLEYGKTIAGAENKDNISYGLSLDRLTKNKAILDVVLPRVVYGTVHNIYNVIEKGVIMESLQCIVEELKTEGIIINDQAEWNVYSMEINKTIVSEKPLVGYREGILWLLDNAFFSGYTKEDNDYKGRLKDGSISNTYYYGTNRIGKKIYDKTAQIKDTLEIYIKENMIRSEVTYNKEAIERAFKSTMLQDVLDEEKIRDLYNKSTQVLGDYLKEFAEKTICELESKFTKANYKEIDKVYKENAMKIFDIIFLLEAIQRAYKRYGNRNVSRDIKKLLKCYDTTMYGKYIELSNILIAFNNGIEVDSFDKINKYFQ